MQGGRNNNDDDDDVKTWIFNACIVKWDEINQRCGHLQGSQVGTASSLVNLQESGISDGIWSLEGTQTWRVSNWNLSVQTGWAV